MFETLPRSLKDENNVIKEEFGRVCDPSFHPSWNYY
jgi:hypothetical protein